MERPRKDTTPIDDAQVAELIEAGKSAQAIAAELGRTAEGVRKSAKRSGMHERLLQNTPRLVPVCDEPLTQARLKEMLDYDQETGVFTRRVARPGARAGTVAGHLHPKGGYIYIALDGRQYLAHRLAWFYVHGSWPVDLIDHINRNKTDNRIANLREGDASLNAQNAVAPRAGKELPIGVFPSGRRFVANITVNRTAKHLGSFATPEEAHAAYQAAKNELHAGAVQ